MNEELMNRLKFFLYDLNNFNTKKIKNRILDNLSIRNPQYMFPTYYFTEDEIYFLLNYKSSENITYKQAFDNMINSKNNVYEVCTSHDIAPLIYNFFKIPKNFNRSKQFNKLYKDYSTNVK